MSDLFHKEIPETFVDRVFETMEHASWHTFQVLTKRSSLLRRYINDRYHGRAAPPNIWLGVSVENRSVLNRVWHLATTNSSVRFVSFEPLLEDLGLIDLTGIHWAIAGGESGPSARPVEADWIRNIRDQCETAAILFSLNNGVGARRKPAEIASMDAAGFSIRNTLRPEETMPRVGRSHFNTYTEQNRVEHAILTKYLAAYLRALAKTAHAFHYIDGFAGPGRYAGEHPGSPITALQLLATQRRPATASVNAWSRSSTAQPAFRSPPLDE